MHQELLCFQTCDTGPFSDIRLLEKKPAHMAVLLHYLISNSDPCALVGLSAVCLSVPQSIFLVLHCVSISVFLFLHCLSLHVTTQTFISFLSDSLSFRIDKSLYCNFKQNVLFIHSYCFFHMLICICHCFF